MYFIPTVSHLKYVYVVSTYKMHSAKHRVNTKKCNRAALYLNTIALYVE